MAIQYKVDILDWLKAKGYNTNVLRSKHLLSEGVIQSLREGKAISFSNLNKLCELLECRVEDLIEFVPEKNNKAIFIGFLPLSFLKDA